jgi:hypothetical protein
VNQVLGTVDSMAMLCWCQRHIRCDALSPLLEFASPTRRLGPRVFLHSAPLLKARSSRALIALLFNDLLLLTTPNEHIDEVFHRASSILHVQLDSFKLTKNSDVNLTLYKSPILLDGLSIVPNAPGDDVSLTLKTGELKITRGLRYACETGAIIVNLKAMNRNSRSMWINQLESAMRDYTIAITPRPRKVPLSQCNQLACRGMTRNPWDDCWSSSCTCAISTCNSFPRGFCNVA